MVPRSVGPSRSPCSSSAVLSTRTNLHRWCCVTSSLVSISVGTCHFFFCRWCCDGSVGRTKNTRVHGTLRQPDDRFEVPRLSPPPTPLTLERLSSDVSTWPAETDGVRINVKENDLYSNDYTVWGVCNSSDYHSKYQCDIPITIIVFALKHCVFLTLVFIFCTYWNAFNLE